MPDGRPVRRRILRTALLTLLGFVLVLGLAEFALHQWQQRATNPEAYVPDAVLGYRFRSGRFVTSDGSFRSANREGLFADEVPRERPRNEVRILFLGDSITCAYYLEEGWNVPSRVARILSESDPGHRYRAINGAIPGYTAQQGLLLLDRVGPLYRPDVIVACFLNNDRNEKLYGPVPPGDLGLWVRGLLYESELYRLRYRAMFRDTAEIPGPYSPDPHGDDYDEAWRANLRAFADGARRLGAGILYVEQPLTFTDPTPERSEKPRQLPSMSPERHREMVAMLREETEGRGLPLVRVASEPGFTQVLPEYYIPDDLFHPSEVGCEFMALAIANALRAHRLVPARE